METTEQVTPAAIDSLTEYQRDELARMTSQGWTLVRVRRLHDDLNPWASINMCSPEGTEMLTALPATMQDADWMMSS